MPTNHTHLKNFLSFQNWAGLYEQDHASIGDIEQKKDFRNLHHTSVLNFEFIKIDYNKIYYKVS